MKKHYLFGALAAAAVAIVACTGQAEQKPQGLVIEKQGVFSSGGRVTEAIPGEYDPTQNWLDPERKGTTTHVDHANTLYQIPVDGTGNSIVFLHGYGQTRVGWATDTDNMAAVIAVEPGFAPEVGSDTYKKFAAAKIPMLFLFGDYIENGPEDIQSTGFWRMALNQCRDFAKQYNADGGDATVIYLPEQNIKGNSHFMFQEKNNAEIADLIGEWLKKHNL